MDITSKSTSNDSSLITHSTVPGEVSISLGGVGRNIAEAAHRSMTANSRSNHDRTLLLSPVGSDSFGRLLLDETSRIGMRTDGYIVSQDQRTAVCSMILDDKGSLLGGVADMNAIESVDDTSVRISSRPLLRRL